MFELARAGGKAVVSKAMRYEAALLAIGLVVAPALADAAARTVTVTKETCAQLVKHDPAADVAYEGGVDVHGNAVAPAELGGGHDLKLPETITIPITVELFETGAPGGEDDGSADDPAVPVEGAGFTADAKVGTVTVDLETGRARFNGRPITSRAQHELAERCQERFGTGTP